MPKYSLRNKEKVNYNVRTVLNKLVNDGVKAQKERRRQRLKRQRLREKKKKLAKETRWSMVNRWSFGVRLFKLFKRSTPRNKYVDQLYNICYQYEENFDNDFHLLKLSEETLDQLKYNVAEFESNENLLRRGFGTDKYIWALTKRLEEVDESHYPKIIELYNLYAPEYIMDDSEEVELKLYHPFPIKGLRELNNLLKSIK